MKLFCMNLNIWYLSLLVLIKTICCSLEKHSKTLATSIIWASIFNEQKL